MLNIDKLSLRRRQHHYAESRHIPLAVCIRETIMLGTESVDLKQDGALILPICRPSQPHFRKEGVGLEVGLSCMNPAKQATSMQIATAEFSSYPSNEFWPHQVRPRNGTINGWINVLCVGSVFAQEAWQN